LATLYKLSEVGKLTLIDLISGLIQARASITVYRFYGDEILRNAY
jgi:ABC-type molybdate transport system ATPase subunit